MHMASAEFEHELTTRIHTVRITILDVHEYLTYIYTHNMHRICGQPVHPLNQPVPPVCQAFYSVFSSVCVWFRCIHICAQHNVVHGVQSFPDSFPAARQTSAKTHTLTDSLLTIVRQHTNRTRIERACHTITSIKRDAGVDVCMTANARKCDNSRWHAIVASVWARVHAD